MKMVFHPQPIHENCKGCARVNEKTEPHTCTTYEVPQFKWEPRPGVMLAADKVIYCPMATHFDAMPEAIQHKINPLKASKRAAGAGGKKKKR